MLKGLLFLVLPYIASCWWEVGHMLTAAIAEIRLNQMDIYASANFRELSLAINNLCDNRSRTFIESSVWPDDIKEKQYSMNIWNDLHFKDIPHVTDAIIPILNYTAISINSLNTINQAKTALKTNMKKITAERALFSRYLIHMVGDIHQPLHSVALYNKTYPKGDAGGNLLKIQMLNGSLSNFHSFWDSGAFLLQNDTYQFVRPLNLRNESEIKRLASEMILKYGKQVQADAKILDPVLWLKQSFEVAQNTTYPHMMKTNIANEQYTNLVFETSKKRITLAGFRLANMVIDIFNPKSSSEINNLDLSLKSLFQHSKNINQNAQYFQHNEQKILKNLQHNLSSE